MTKIEIGRFTYDPATGSIEGPAAYLRERGNAEIERINRGDIPATIEFGMAMDADADPVRLVLVHLQTDFAGWLGQRQLMNQIETATHLDQGEGR